MVSWVMGYILSVHVDCSFYGQGSSNVLLTSLSIFIFVCDHICQWGTAESGQPWGTSSALKPQRNLSVFPTFKLDGCPATPPLVSVSQTR